MVSHTIKKLLEEARSRFLFSGYQLYAEARGSQTEFTGGQTSYWPHSVAVNESTLFDIGSLTKVVVTTSVLARAVSRGEFTLENTVDSYLPSLKPTWLGKIQLVDLLSHSSGLKWWHPIHEELGKDEGPSKLEAWFSRRAAELQACSPGEKAIYSDLNILLLGLVLQSRFPRLDKAFEGEVRQKLKMTETLPGPVRGQNIAATEYCIKKQRPLQGEVFDENARQLGTLSHAGLFSTARALAPFCQEWLKAVKGKSEWLDEKTALKFTKRRETVPQSSWALGWDTKSAEGSSAGSQFSPRSFGHLGYPGCSIWIDPEKEGFVIFFSNRVHPSRYDERIRAFRPLLHNAIAEQWRQSWKS